MELDALAIAYEVSRKEKDTKMFAQIVEKIQGRLGSDFGWDKSWEESVERQYESFITDGKISLKGLLSKVTTQEQIDHYQLTPKQIRENEIIHTYNIRNAYDALGNLHYAHGQLTEAYENYLAMGGYCLKDCDMIDMCMKLIVVNIEMDKFELVMIFVSKAEQMQDALDSVMVAKLRAAAGLCYLKDKKYELAAQKFVEIGPELGNSFMEVIVPQDIATYGGLCALACFNRRELKSKVIDSINFQHFLDYVPVMSELIKDFYSCKYASCLEYLGRLKPKLMVDIHLSEHVETLYHEIREKALIEYINPHLSVDLHEMGKAFEATSVADLENELAAMISKGQIQALLDSQNKVLYTRQGDTRSDIFGRVLEAGCEEESELIAALQRLMLLKRQSN